MAREKRDSGAKKKLKEEKKDALARERRDLLADAEEGRDLVDALVGAERRVDVEADGLGRAPGGEDFRGGGSPHGHGCFEFFEGRRRRTKRSERASLLSLSAVVFVDGAVVVVDVVVNVVVVQKTRPIGAFTQRYFFSFRFQNVRTKVYCARLCEFGPETAQHARTNPMQLLETEKKGKKEKECERLVPFSLDRPPLRKKKKRTKEKKKRKRWCLPLGALVRTFFVELRRLKGSV